MKSKIVDELKGYGMTSTSAEQALSDVFEATAAVIKRDGVARIPGFGTFKIKRRAERMSRNPRTGEQIKVAARDALTFKPSKPAI